MPSEKDPKKSQEHSGEIKLTSEEEELCRRFHWDPVGYLKRKREMTMNQTEDGLHARFRVSERTAPATTEDAVRFSASPEKLRRLVERGLLTQVDGSHKKETVASEQSQKTAAQETTTPAVPNGKLRSQLPARGKRCEELAEEIKKIKRFYDDGQSMSEIRTNYSTFSIWKAIEPLPQEDKDTFTRPGTWGPSSGYANNVLGKLYGKSPITVNNWRKQYREHLRNT